MVNVNKGPVIEFYKDPRVIKNGQVGGYRARIQDNHGIHAVGTTKDEAIADLLKTAQSMGLSGDLRSYTVTEISK
jgi:hypothetical protein